MADDSRGSAGDTPSQHDDGLARQPWWEGSSAAVMRDTVRESGGLSATSAPQSLGNSQHRAELAQAQLQGPAHTLDPGIQLQLGKEAGGRRVSEGCQGARTCSW